MTRELLKRYNDIDSFCLSLHWVKYYVPTNIYSNKLMNDMRLFWGFFKEKFFFSKHDERY